jgi:hypothetical protein
MSNSLDITRCFTQAFKLYRQHWAPLLGIAALLFALPIAALTVVVLFRPKDDASVIVLVLIYVFLDVTGKFWYRAFTTHLIWSKRKGEEVSTATLVKRTFQGFPRISTVGFLVWMGTVFGMIFTFFLAFVPGIIFGTRRAPAISVAVVEGKGAFYGRRYRDPDYSAMRRSRDLVKGTGNSFEMFAVIAAKLVVYAAFGSILPALNVLAIPWGSLATSMAYFELVEIEQRGPAPTDVASPQQGPAVPPPVPGPPAHDSGWRPQPGQVSGPGP